MAPRPPRPSLFPYTTLFRSAGDTFRAGAIDQLRVWAERTGAEFVGAKAGTDPAAVAFDAIDAAIRSEEHTSELQSLRHLVCRLLLEKKKKLRREFRGVQRNI